MNTLRVKCTASTEIDLKTKFSSGNTKLKETKKRKSPIQLADGCKKIIRTTVSLSLRSRTDAYVISEKQKL